MIRPIKVVKFRKGEKVFEEVLGNVLVFENRISTKVFEKYKKIVLKKWNAGRQEHFEFYVGDQKVNPPAPLVDFAKLSIGGAKEC